MRWLCLLPLLVGCSALTEFDYAFGDGDAGVTDAGATDAGATDAGVTDAGPRIDAGPGLDGGVAFTPCPGSCVGDLDEDFEPGDQSFADLSWRFAADPRDRLGIDHDALGWNAAVSAYTDGTASVGRCDDADCPPGSFAMTTSGASGGVDPVIELTAPSTGVFRLGLGYAHRGGEAAELLITRGHRADAIAIVEVDPLVAEPQQTTIDVFLSMGDRLRIALRARDPGHSPTVAVAPWLADEGLDTCLGAIDFDTWPALPSECAMITTELLDTGGGSPPTESTGPHPDFGSAVRISSADNAYARLDGTTGLDLSGDFTIQLWAQREEELGTPQLEAIFANAGDDPMATRFAGGLSLDYDAIRPAEAIEMSVFLEDGTIVARSSGYEPGTEWHFYRIVRRDERVELCVDGESVITPFAAAGNLTSTHSARLGRFRSEGVFFTGSIDEVAFFDEALPCEVPVVGAP